MKFTKATYTKDGGEWRKRILYAFPETLFEFLYMIFQLDYRRIDLEEFGFEGNENEPEDFYGAFMKEFEFNQPFYIENEETQKEILEKGGVKLYLEKDKINRE